MTISSKAIFRRSSYGPTFGNAYDIYIADKANSGTASFADFGGHDGYFVPIRVQDKRTILAGTLHFSPDEVEVFYLG